MSGTSFEKSPVLKDHLRFFFKDDLLDDHVTFLVAIGNMTRNWFAITMYFILIISITSHNVAKI